MYPWYNLSINRLIEEAESHVVIGFFLWLFFFLFFLFFSCSSTASCWGSTTSCWSSTYARTYVSDEILDVAAFKSLGKQSWPIRFYINACCLEDGLDLFSLQNINFKLKNNSFFLKLAPISPLSNLNSYLTPESRSSALENLSKPLQT